MSRDMLLCSGRIKKACESQRGMKSSGGVGPSEALDGDSEARRSNLLGFQTKVNNDHGDKANNEVALPSKATECQ